MKQFSEITIADKRIKEVIDMVTATVIEPTKGISDIGIELIRKYKGGSDFWSISG